MSALSVGVRRSSADLMGSRASESASSSSGNKGAYRSRVIVALLWPSCRLTAFKLAPERTCSDLQPGSGASGFRDSLRLVFAGVRQDEDGPGSSPPGSTHEASLGYGVTTCSR